MEVKLKVKRESEKAVLVHAYIRVRDDVYDSVEYGEDIWLPKSQIKIDEGVVIDIPDWLIKKNKISRTNFINN